MIACRMWPLVESLPSPEHGGKSRYDARESVTVLPFHSRCRIIRFHTLDGEAVTILYAAKGSLIPSTRTHRRLDLHGVFDFRQHSRKSRFALADSFTLGTEHKCGVTDTLDFFGLPHGIDGGTTEAVRASLLCAPFRPPCQRTGAPVRDSQWPGRRNLPRRGTPRRAPVCCGGLMTPKTMTSRTPR
jgi:hypothetical protein